MQARLFVGQPGEEYENTGIVGEVWLQKRPPRILLVNSSGVVVWIQEFPKSKRVLFKTKGDILFFDGVKECFAMQFAVQTDARIVAESMNSYYDLFGENDSPDLDLPQMRAGVQRQPKEDKAPEPRKSQKGAQRKKSSESGPKHNPSSAEERGYIESALKEQLEKLTPLEVPALLDLDALPTIPEKVPDRANTLAIQKVAAAQPAFQKLVKPEPKSKSSAASMPQGTQGSALPSDGEAEPQPEAKQNEDEQSQSGEYVYEEVQEECDEVERYMPQKQPNRCTGM